jgi:hypothetical protein
MLRLSRGLGRPKNGIVTLDASAYNRGIPESPWVKESPRDVTAMSVFFVRPRVADLVFQLYARPLHPEVFDTVVARPFDRDDYKLTVRITRTGHVITWRNASLTLTELADIDQNFANHRRLLHYRMRGEHAATYSCGDGITYQVSFQVETLAPEIFRHVHEEILSDGAKRGILHNFQPNHRLTIAPLGYVAVDSRPGCIFLSAFHTFPEENTVIKSQSLIERK